jgi:uncharacterized protein
VAIRFSRDRRKAASNRGKHDVSFQEAASLFRDQFSITIPDPDHSVGEERFLIVGFSVWKRLLVVAYAEHDDEVRIINARLASRRERRVYEEGE